MVIFAIILGVMGSIFATISRNPFFYRQPIFLLRTSEAALANKLETSVPLNLEKIQAILERQARLDNLRFAVVDKNGQVIIDSNKETAPPIPLFSSPPVVTGSDPISFDTFRDKEETVWLYILRPLNENTYLLAASKRNHLDFGIIFRDDIIGPMMRTSLVALVLAFILGMFMSAWIGNPLKRLADGVRQIERGSYPVLRKEGPREVQELAESFNQMSSRVQQTEESQRDFLANVSHELKTPLTSIQGFAQSILDGAASSAQDLHQAADIIYTEAARMHRLVIDLLTLSKLEDGTANLQYSPVNLSDLVEQVGEKMQPQIHSAGLTIKREIEPFQFVIGDTDRLAQVFTNLVDNAIKFTPSGGNITLRVQAEQTTILASVSDTGAGIPAQEEARIFERFYQVDKSRRGGSSRGIGLGLSIARQIILSQKGEIWLKSEPNKGSTFFIRLPSNNKPTLRVSKIAQ
ncbi:MAG: HAMP domain-containing sensor histidine kinase [Leptolinea sp.]